MCVSVRVSQAQKCTRREMTNLEAGVEPEAVLGGAVVRAHHALTVRKAGALTHRVRSHPHELLKRVHKDRRWTQDARPRGIGHNQWHWKRLSEVCFDSNFHFTRHFGA